MASDSAVLKRLAWTKANGTRGLFPFGLLVALLALLGVGWMRTSSPLVVVIDGQRFPLRTHAKTVGAALHQAGFDLHTEDVVSPGLDSPLRAGSLVQVRRARSVSLSVDGRVQQHRTQASAVGEFLEKVGVTTGPADELWMGGRLVGLDTPIDGPGSMSETSSQLGGGGEYTDPSMIVLRRATSLILDDGGKAATLHTTSQTVGQVLQEQGVRLYLGDEVMPGLQERITPGLTVTILRSVPVRIEVDGRVIHTRSRAETVAGVLGQEGIALVGADRVVPGLNEEVRSDMAIRVIRVRKEFLVEAEPVPFDTVWVGDPEVEIDNIRLAHDGQVGLTKRRYRVVYENEREVERVLEDVWAAQPPITKTMAYGTKIVVRTLDTPDGPVEYWRKMRVYTTSYTAASAGKPKSHPRWGYTRLGWWLTKGIVAVDPEVIPLRTKIYVPGYGIGRAGDTGGGVKGKFVDLGFDQDNYESWHWWTDVYILTPVPPQDEIRWVLPDWPKYPDRKRK